MSSPIAKTQKRLLDRLLIRTHQATSHSHRVQILAQSISVALRNSGFGAVGCNSLLDVGCGDMTLAHMIGQELKGALVSGVDLYDLPPNFRGEAQWINYSRFDGQHLPHGNGEFGAALFCDVLHHASEQVRVDLLREALRVASVVVIKDHFEYGWCSRQTLRAMDFVGNYGYGVSVPRAYFSRKSFEDLVSVAGGRVESMRVGINLYDHLPIVRRCLKSKWHFIATVRRPQ